MSQLRRRSQDVRTQRTYDASTSKSRTRHFPKSAKLMTTVIIIFLVTAGLLSTRLRWDSRNQDVAMEQTSLHHPNRLFPEHHVFRQPTIINQKWRITSGMRRPDGVLKRVYLINDSFPGPTVECRSGDRLVIEVENALHDEELSIHWHGLTLKRANEMDGAIGITNAPIQPGKSFTYDFKIEESQSGSFWYHSHHQNQRADGLYGALVVHEPKAKGDPELDLEYILLIGDWYHRSGGEALHFYSHPGSFGNEPVPDSILLNGNGVFNCSDAAPARPLDCEDQRSADIAAALSLDTSRRNVVRIVNVGSYAGIGLSGLLFVPFAVDGGNRIGSRPAKSLQYLHPGERVDVVIHSEDNTDINESTLRVSLDTSQFKYPNPSLTPTHAFPVVWTGARTQAAQMDEAVVESFDLQTLQAAQGSHHQLPARADQQILLYAKTQRLAFLENKPQGFINHTSWKPQTSPPQPLRDLKRDMWDENQFVPHVVYNSRRPLWVDIILNNLDEESHPFHLHGYDFWVLTTYSSSFNWGSFNPFEDDSPPGGAYNLVNPVRKDTVYVPRRGYAVLRFKADNPGIWMFHCHVLWHQASGMAMSFEVGP